MMGKELFTNFVRGIIKVHFAEQKDALSFLKKNIDDLYANKDLSSAASCSFLKATYKTIGEFTLQDKSYGINDLYKMAKKSIAVNWVWHMIDLGLPKGLAKSIAYNYIDDLIRKMTLSL